MKILKKLVAWFEDLLWTRAIEDVFGNPESYLGVEDKDGIFIFCKICDKQKAKRKSEQDSIDKDGDTK